MRLKNERLSLVLITPGRMRFAASPGVTCSRLRLTREESGGPKGGNCRDLNLLTIGTGAVDLTQLAARARG